MNLLPENLSDKWYTKEPEVKKSVCFKAEETGLAISTGADTFGMGKWCTKLPVSDQKHYKISATAIVKNAKVNNVYAIYNVFDAENRTLIREHIENVEITENGFVFSGRVEVPQGGSALELELWLTGYSNSVLWQNLNLSECEAEPQRKVKIALAYISPAAVKNSTLEKCKEIIINAIENSAKHNPDVIMLSEAMYGRGTGLPLNKTAETTKGSMCNLMREKAAENNCYIIYNFHELDKGEYYNTSILIGRKGETVGLYRKTHLTVRELENGMTPGKEYPVFETDFGKIGILTCFDHYFPETAERIANNGAEIVFVASAGDAEEKFSARAMDTGVYFAVCGWNTENRHGWGPARVVSPTGEIIAETHTNLEPAVCEIDLSKRVRRPWLSVGPGNAQFKGVYFYEKNSL